MAALLPSLLFSGVTMALSYSFPWRQSHEGLSDYKDEEQEDGPYVIDGDVESDSNSVIQ